MSASVSLCCIVQASSPAAARMSTGLAGHRFVDHLAVDRADTLGVLGKNGASLRHGRGIRRQRSIDRHDLRRVDGGLGGKPIATAAATSVLEAGLVVQVEKGQNRSASSPAKRTGRDQPAAREGQAAARPWPPRDQPPGRRRPASGRPAAGSRPRSLPRRRGRAYSIRPISLASLAAAGQQPVEDLKVHRPSPSWAAPESPARPSDRAARVEVGNAGRVSSPLMRSARRVPAVGPPAR